MKSVRIKISSVCKNQIYFHISKVFYIKANQSFICRQKSRHQVYLSSLSIIKVQYSSWLNEGKFLWNNLSKYINCNELSIISRTKRLDFFDVKRIIFLFVPRKKKWNAYRITYLLWSCKNCCRFKSAIKAYTYTYYTTFCILLLRSRNYGL